MNAVKLRKARPNYDVGDTDANSKPIYWDSQLFRIIPVLQHNGFLTLASTYICNEIDNTVVLWRQDQITRK